MRASDTIIPSVQAMSLNECPLPTTRTRLESSTARSMQARSCSIVAGRSSARGMQRWSPAQLLQLGARACRSQPRGSLRSLI